MGHYVSAVDGVLTVTPQRGESPYGGWRCDDDPDFSRDERLYENGIAYIVGHADEGIIKEKATRMVNHFMRWTPPPEHASLCLYMRNIIKEKWLIGLDTPDPVVPPPPPPPPPVVWEGVEGTIEVVRNSDGYIIEARIVFANDSDQYADEWLDRL